MRPTDFKAFLNLLADYITKKDTNSHINASVCSIFVLLLKGIFKLLFCLFLCYHIKFRGGLHLKETNSNGTQRQNGAL